MFLPILLLDAGEFIADAPTSAEFVRTTGVTTKSDNFNGGVDLQNVAQTSTSHHADIIWSDSDY